MKITLNLLTTIACVMTITGCMHSGQVFQRQDFTAYLDQFVGKSKDEVTQSINLQQFGFQTATRAKSLQTDQQLVYSIVRPLNIPIPMPAQANFGNTGSIGGVGGTGMSMSGATGANSYEVSATCNIIFSLENNVVTQWQTKGKAC